MIVIARTVTTDTYGNVNCTDYVQQYLYSGSIPIVTSTTTYTYIETPSLLSRARWLVKRVIHNALVIWKQAVK